MTPDLNPYTPGAGITPNTHGERLQPAWWRAPVDQLNAVAVKH